jgi:hypothetical protein
LFALDNHTRTLVVRLPRREFLQRETDLPRSGSGTDMKSIAIIGAGVAVSLVSIALAPGAIGAGLFALLGSAAALTVAG